MSALDDERHALLMQLRQRAVEEKNIQSENKKLRQELIDCENEEKRTEDALKALQTAGQMIGEVLKQLTEEKFIVKASSGPRYVVGCRSAINKSLLKTGDRVSLDYTTLTIMRRLPREVDPMVFKMLDEDPGHVSYKSIGGLNEQIREIRESIELPLTNPELFARVGIKPPKGVLLYGPPGTGKTLLARAMANEMDCNFMKIVSSSIVDKYIGESARLIREMFAYGKSHSPCIIFFDEIDAIGGRRLSAGTSADREIQRTLMELMSQIDGFDDLGQVKVMMATNRPDILDPALLRPGRLDRKIEFPLPDLKTKKKIFGIHTKKMTLANDVIFEDLVSSKDDLSGADIKAMCTEAGLLALRERRMKVTHSDFEKAKENVLYKKKKGVITSMYL
mmetsp:Transcript_50357/g.45130  ORF Transcript_50357/g.45130 Transcript_50357/m.45130 type:complete len:392 (+) Transcript_50357:143-1318(+)